MNLINTIKEHFRAELPVDQSILERERRFNEEDDYRESWVLNYMHLCEGDLEALKKHPDSSAAGQVINCIIAYYAKPEGKKGPCRRVVVSVPLTPDEQATINLVENKLKLDLFSRGCNSGVFYRHYKKDGQMFAEAVPAVLTGE